MTGTKALESNLLVRWLFLRLLGIIHLMAFGSFAFQIIGLNGSHGILPTQDILQELSDRSEWQRYLLCPTLAWFNSSDAFLQGMTVAGSLLSLLVILGIATAPSLLALAVLWLSLSSGGGEFTGFQSDGMLVEVTALALFFAPWQFFEPPWPVPKRFRLQSKPPPASLWLLRFMFFRIMFVSGVLKILSGDQSWSDLTAMQYHYETQPIPTPLAWYVHKFPAWIHKLSVLGMFVAELLAPLCIVGPRKLRLAACALMFALHFFIALNGNYTFLSFLMMSLCLTLLDDELLGKLLPGALVQALADSVDERIPGRVREFAYKSLVFLFFSVAITVSCASVLGRQVLPGLLRPVVAVFAQLQLANSYGLFAVMTKTRPELVFEGSKDGKTWLAYEFACKPGDDLRRAPPWVAPHMPRLDWRLWFAAMRPLEDNQWVLALVKRMLEGSPELNWFFARNPFPKNPPKYIRVFVYDYHFSDYAERNSTGRWWRRDNKQAYMPAVIVKDGLLEVPPATEASQSLEAPDSERSKK